MQDEESEILKKYPAHPVNYLSFFTLRPLRLSLLEGARADETMKMSTYKKSFISAEPILWPLHLCTLTSAFLSHSGGCECSARKG